ncbi:family 4 carbohydrate esterase, partial [Rhizoclosmatium globosum]
CDKDWQAALTFDDGPGKWTGELLDYLAEQGIKATFFVNGKNWNCIYNPIYTDFLIRAYNEGHQIGHHTWSHKALTEISDDQVHQEMQLLDDAFYRILGFVPRYMRPPYGAGVRDPRIEAIMKQRGYVIVGWSVYSYDADMDDGRPAGKHLEYNPGGGYITLNHDVYERTVKNTTVFEVELLRSLGYNPVPASICLGDPNPQNWYRNYTTPEARNNATWVC